MNGLIVTTVRSIALVLFIVVNLYSANTIASDWAAKFSELPPESSSLHSREVEKLWAQINQSIRKDMDADYWSGNLSNEKEFKSFSRRWVSLDQQLTVRSLLISHLPEKEQDRVLGFGPTGVRQLQLELNSLQLRARHTAWLVFHGAIEFSEETLVSPVPIIVALIKLGLLIAIFYYWRRSVVPVIDRFKTSNVTLKALASWWYIRLRIPLEWLVFISLCISILETLWEFIDFYPLLVVLRWTLGGVILLRFVDGLRASRYRRGGRKDAQAALRLKSIKLAGFILIIAYATRAFLYSLEADGGTFEFWVIVTLLWVTLPVAIIIITWWRPVVFSIIDKEELNDNFLLRWIKANREGVVGLLASVVGAIYLSLKSTVMWLLSVVTQQDIVKTWTAYFFRVEVARQAAKESDRDDYTPLEGVAVSNLRVDYLPNEWLEDVAEAELDRVAQLSCHKRSTISLIHAGRGGGKSSFLRRLEPKVANDKKVIVVECLPGGFNELMDQLALQMGIEEKEGRAKAVIAKLKSEEQLLICIDDLHRIICPAIGGLHELDRLVRLIRSSAQEVSWVLAIETPSWRFVERARGERFQFDVEVSLPRWTDKQIDQLINQRVVNAQLEPNFDALELPSSLSQVAIGRDESSSVAYTRMLWEYAKGNPRISLGLWYRSLYEGQEGSVQVKLFSMPDTTDLDGLGVTLLLVLRAVLQLEMGAKKDIARCTNLNSDEVVDALRLLVSRGYVERIGEHLYGVRWFWYRAIVQVLDRQHLLKI